MVFLNSVYMWATLLRLVWILACSSLTIIGVGLGVRYDWPDFVHVDYGFPMRWATHTLITLTGPADHWSVDLVMLLVDVGFWQTVLTIGMLVLELKIIKR
jgi:hypothetical protein